jgi:C-terminal processing protease CtpA/Prc
MIQRFLNLFVLTLAGLLAAGGALRAKATDTAPVFNQVYELLRANLPNTSDAELNSAAVKGLLRQLHGRATLVGGTTGTTLSSGTAEPVKSAVLESNVAYLRVGAVESGLADKMNAAYHALAATNKVAGVALDLRFAGGNDYAAAIAVADLFTAKKTTLLEWDKEVEESPPAGEPIPGPLVVLVNGETGGAAEALAAALREADAGLIIGNPTAGLAMTTRDFPLKNGERLRIAMNPVKLGNGVAISHVAPDIAVTVSPDDERAYLKNPYLTLAQNNAPAPVRTNDFLPFVDHTSEADLVQQKIKDGDDAGAIAPAHVKSQAKPVIQDPVLARAVDLIKALAIVHESRL